MDHLKAASVSLLVFGIVYHYFCQVSQNRLHQSLEDRLVVRVHRGTRVDLDQPHLKLIVHHEIVAEEFKTILSIVHHVLDAQSSGLDLLVDLWEDVVSENVVRVFEFILKLAL